MPSKWMEQYMKRKFDDHRKRVREAKSTIERSKPPEMPMTMRREGERRRQQAAIERDNRLLLDRLAIAMTTKNIDNELKVKPFTSYMELQRKKQLKKLQVENKRMLDRIQQTVPSYRHVEWELEAEKRVEYLRNMTEFPDLFVPPGSSRKASRQRSASANSSRRRGTSSSPNRHLTHEIENQSPFTSFEKKLAGRSEDNEEDENHFQPPLPEPLPMQQYPSSSTGGGATRRIDRPVMFPEIHNKTKQQTR